MASDPSDQSAWIPQGTIIADRYEIQSGIGQGGFGQIYKARDLRVNRIVCLKIIAGAGASFVGLRARFEREAQIGAQLGDDPSFVRALDWGELGDGFRLYLAMDLVPDAHHLDLESGSLADKVGRVLAAARIVAKLHERGLAHRDLKPSNLLATPEGGLVLIDFGLAKNLEENDETAGQVEQSLAGSEAGMTRTGDGVGTPLFTAPEQFQDAKSVGFAADVYSLGVMLFYAATGSYPYSGSTAQEIMLAQVRTRLGDLKPPCMWDRAPVSPDLDAVCQKALALAPEGRYQTASALVHALEAAQASIKTSSSGPRRAPAEAQRGRSSSSGPALARPPTPAERPVVVYRRSGSPALPVLRVAGVVLAVAVLLVVAFAWDRKKDRADTADRSVPRATLIPDPGNEVTPEPDMGPNLDPALTEISSVPQANVLIPRSGPNVYLHGIALADEVEGQAQVFVEKSVRQGVTIELVENAPQRSGRAAAYVWLADGTHLNQTLVREGLALSIHDDFYDDEEAAKREGLGYWRTEAGRKEMGLATARTPNQPSSPSSSSLRPSPSRLPSPSPSRRKRGGAAQGAWWLEATQEEVKQIQGAPDSATNYLWRYGRSGVSFDRQGLVDGYVNEGELRVESPVRLRVAYWELGASKEDLLRCQGVPDTATEYYWDYGRSRVRFDRDGLVDGYVNNGELKVR